MPELKNEWAKDAVYTTVELRIGGWDLLWPLIGGRFRIQTVVEVEAVVRRNDPTETTVARLKPRWWMRLFPAKQVGYVAPAENEDPQP